MRRKRDEVKWGGMSDGKGKRVKGKRVKGKRLKGGTNEGWRERRK